MQSLSAQLEGAACAEKAGICCRVSSFQTGWGFQTSSILASTVTLCPRRKRRSVH